MHNIYIIGVILSGFLGVAFGVAAVVQFSVLAPMEFAPVRGPRTICGAMVRMSMYPVHLVYRLLRAMLGMAINWRKLPEAHLTLYLGTAFSIMAIGLIVAGH